MSPRTFPLAFASFLGSAMVCACLTLAVLAAACNAGRLGERYVSMCVENGAPDDYACSKGGRYAKLALKADAIQPSHSVLPFRQMATDAAGLCGVPVRIFHALIARESSWRPDVVSSSGAVGLAQVKPSTGRGVSPTLDVREPWQNLVAGACYLRQMRDLKGSWRAGLHAYRAGPNRKRTTAAHRAYADGILNAGGVE